MKVTFLVNSYDKPTNLWCILGSLIQQTDPSWEAIVLQNSPSFNDRLEQRVIVDSMNDDRIYYEESFHHHPAWDCYWACDWAVEEGLAEGEWICCASDDGYYMPEFIEEMTRTDADLVICDGIMTKHLTNRRGVVNTLPKCGYVDKTMFLVKREKWIGFPDKNQEKAGPSAADGMAVERMVKLGYKLEKVHLPLVVHN